MNALARTSTRYIAFKWGPRLACLAWAGFWAWFVVVVGVSDIRSGLHGTGAVMAAWLAGLGALTFTLWRWPRIGGLVFIAAAIAAAVYFASPGARLLLSLPALVIGAAAVLSPRPAREEPRVPS